MRTNIEPLNDLRFRLRLKWEELHKSVQRTYRSKRKYERKTMKKLHGCTRWTVRFVNHSSLVFFIGNLIPFRLVKMIFVSWSRHYFLIAFLLFSLSTRKAVSKAVCFFMLILYFSNFLQLINFFTVVGTEELKKKGIFLGTIVACMCIVGV